MPAKPVAAAKAGQTAPARRGLAGLSTVAIFSASCFVLGFMLGSNLLITAGALAWALLLTPFAAAWASLIGIGGVWTLGTARLHVPQCAG